MIKEVGSSRGSHIVIVIENFVKALALMGYLYADGKYYKLDGELWKIAPIDDGEKDFWPLERACRNLLDYVKDHWGDTHNGQLAPEGLLLDGRQIDMIVRQFNSTYDLSYLANERRKWINYTQGTMDDFYKRTNGKTGLSSEFLPQDRSMYDVQERIDKRDHILMFRNGFIDIQKRFNMDLIPHTRYLFVPDYFDIDYQNIERDGVNVLNYVCNSLGRPYEDIYKSVIPDEDALSVFLRYCAISVFDLGHVDRFLFIYGTRDSGKSSLRYGLSKLMGSRSSVMTFNDFFRDFGLGPFQYSDLVFMDDCAPPKAGERATLGEMMKTVTNNGDLEIHIKYKRPILVKNHTQIIVISNYDDIFGGMSTSIMKRVIALPCRQTHDNPIFNLKDILESEDAVNWLVNRLLVVYYHDLYHMSGGEMVNILTCDYVLDAKRELFANAGDIVPKFIKEVLEIDATNVDAVREYFLNHPNAIDLERGIEAFCNEAENGYRVPDKNDIRNYMRKEYGFRVDKTHVTNSITGERITVNVGYVKGWYC